MCMSDAKWYCVDAGKFELFSTETKRNKKKRKKKKKQAATRIATRMDDDVDSQNVHFQEILCKMLCRVTMHIEKCNMICYFQQNALI